MYFDRFDICEAYWCYCIHMGRFSNNQLRTVPIIRRLCVDMNFKPRPSLESSPKNLTLNGKAIYMNLVRKYFAVR